MKILVIEGSPHKHGSSNLLADKFAEGAKEAGNEVTVFDSAHAKMNPCLGCDGCSKTGICVQKDDMESLKDMIRKTDMMVFVSPVYYWNISAQLKMVIDRFYSFHMELIGMEKKTALITAANNDKEAVMDAIKSYYSKLCDMMSFKDQGTVLGINCGTVEATKKSDFPDKAYAFGKSIK